MNYQPKVAAFFSKKYWPLFLTFIIIFLSQVLTAIMNIINSLIWWGRIDLNLILIGCIDSLVVTLLISPIAIYLVRHSFNLEEMNRTLHKESRERQKIEEVLVQNEKRLLMITENSRDVIWMLDMDFNFTFLSPSIEQMLGYTMEEYLGKSHQEIISPESYARLMDVLSDELMLENMPDKDVYRSRTIETEQAHKDGTKKWVELTITFVRNSDRMPVGLLGFSRDITDKKAAREALKVSEELYQLLFNSINEVVYSIDLNYLITSISPSIEKYLGYKKEEFLGKPVYELKILPERYLEKGLSQISRVLQGETIESEEYEFFTQDGQIKFAEVSGSPIIGNGKVIGMIAVARDITEQKQTKDALRESEKKYRLIAENTADLISILDMNLHFTYISPASMRLRGFTVEEAIKQDIEQVLTPESMQIALDVFEKEMLLEASGTADPDRTRILELEEYKKDGATIWMEVNLSFLRDKNHKPVEILIVSRDISDRKRIEETLRESEEKFRLTYSSSPDAVNINRLDDGLYVDINEGFARATGYTREEVIGKTSIEINIWHDPADRQKLVQGLQEKGYYENLEAQFRRKDGSLITALMSARVISLKGVLHIISITRDISDRKLLEDKLLQAQKFKAIGTLAGGIAHDFNNLLMGIQGRASLISSALETSDPHLEHLNAIEEYIRSATNLTKQLLGFARGGKYEVKPFDMNDLVLSSSAMFGRTKKEIQIHTNCQTSALVVEADRGQIEQVLLNMYVNAWQAMRHDEGHLYLETKIVTLDETNCKTDQVKPGRYVKVSITDTGAGMDEATRLRIFDPFFTTKEMGRGTGLGLASAYGIIKNHGGMITVYSEVGHGTTFNIYLQISEKEAHREVPIEGWLIKGSATILLIDDEELIIDVGQAMLESLGYRVVVCREGREAVKVISDMGDEIDLVILDMIMPGMDGGTTFDRIREIKPDMPVILSSGYAINGHADKIMRRGCNGFIQKPYNISELSKKIRKVLDAS
jgi:two-component system, cell cycle sensor histidine kinase and response regulator CckA